MYCTYGTFQVECVVTRAYVTLISSYIRPGCFGRHKYRTDTGPFSKIWEDQRHQLLDQLVTSDAIWPVARNAIRISLVNNVLVEETRTY